jgi:hypothetical protein
MAAIRSEGCSFVELTLLCLFEFIVIFFVLAVSVIPSAFSVPVAL